MRNSIVLVVGLFVAAFAWRAAPARFASAHAETRLARAICQAGLERAGVRQDVPQAVPELEKVSDEITAAFDAR